MFSHEQMTLEERVRCGKAWLDEHAPTGYVFNMFRFDLPGGKPRFLVDSELNDYDVLAYAFLHDKRFYGGIAVREHFKLFRPNTYMFGFDSELSEPLTQTDELKAEWEKILLLEFRKACNEAGRLLAQIPKNSKGRRFEDSIFI